MVQLDAQHKKWLREALKQIPECLHFEVEPYLRGCIKRCHAKSRKTFWTWLRIQLSKNGYHDYLLYVSELKLPPEIVEPHQREGFKYAINGDTALILVVDGPDHVVWQVPAAKLEWALNLYPVFLKRLPDLELPESAQCRRLQAQLKKRFPFMTPEQRQAVLCQIEELRAMELRSFAPIPRFTLMKYAGGEEFAVHRLFLDAGLKDVVESVDGNYTNFTTVTVSRTYAPADVTDGLGISNGNRPTIEIEEVTVPNLYIVHSDESQKDFEDAFLQVKKTPQGDINTHLPIQPNATWRAGCHGQVVDAGTFDPLTPDDPVPVDHVGRK